MYTPQLLEVSPISHITKYPQLLNRVDDDDDDDDKHNEEIT